MYTLIIPDGCENSWALPEILLPSFLLVLPHFFLPLASSIYLLTFPHLLPLQSGSRFAQISKTSSSVVHVRWGSTSERSGWAPI